MTTELPSVILMEATACATGSEAVAWLADGHPLALEIDLHRLLRALILHEGDDATRERAVRRLARQLASSDLDSATILFQVETITPASRFREALTRLRSHCAGDTLANITSSTVIASQRGDSFSLEALCGVAGISYKELTDRVSGLPSNPSGPFGPSQLRRAFETLDDIVEDRVTTDLPGAIAVRPLELMLGIAQGLSGWEAIEFLSRKGVPYDVLLAQRAAGGSWLAHRNRTSSRLAPLVADRLSLELDARGLKHRRSTSVGGDLAPQAMSELSGCDNQVGTVVLGASGEVAFGVIFSMARDSGTASKSASRLRAMRRPATLPVAVVVGGPGWAARNETAELALDFSGLLYSERSVPELADEILRTVSTQRTGSP